MNENQVQFEAVIHAPVERVWKALTDKQQMKEWYFPVSDFSAEPGFAFQFPGQGHKGEQYMHHCVVKEVVPLQKLSYSWQYENLEGYSVVSFELFKEGESTRVRLTHTGMDSFPKGNPDFAADSFRQGWNYIMGKSLPEYISRIA